MRYILYMLRIRRVEFRIAEIPILAMPVLLLMEETAQLRSYVFWEGILVVFLLFAFGDMINCLADRDLDAIYKPHLSQAVYGLGVRSVTFQIVISATLALVLGAHLSWQLDRWILLLLVVLGLLLGAAYSVRPIQLKGRGLAQLYCLWLIIFVGPMLFVGLLVTAVPSIGPLIFFGAYGVLQMGIILVNTAEDYPEDLEAGIRTVIVHLGLRRGLALALWLVVVGAFTLLGALALIFYRQHIPFFFTLALVPTVIASFFVIKSLSDLNGSISRMSLENSIQLVKLRAKRVPLWLTLVAWSSLFAAGTLFYAKSFMPM